MAKFISGNELNAKLDEIIKNAYRQLILVSPYIKLHSRLKDELQNKAKDDKLKITVLFGKNEEDMVKSMQQADFEFFKGFPNIEIRYNSRLHAKYYANDDTGLVTSMNLYDFSQNNNIEAGILVKGTFLDMVGLGSGDVDLDAADYFKGVIDKSEPMYRNIPRYEKKILGSKYVSSDVEIDKLSDSYSKTRTTPASAYTKGTVYTTNKSIQPNQVQQPNMGFCIRTGKQIPFNPKRPFTDEAYQSWARFGNDDFPEKFCHFSGEPSNGETTKAKPILRKNWGKAKGKT